MTFKVLLTVVFIISFLPGATATAEEPPRVKVSAQIVGETFQKLIPHKNVPALLYSLAKQVATSAQTASPCMEWTADDPKPGSPKPTAALNLVFERVPYGNSFRIRLSYKAKFGSNKEHPLSDRLGGIVMSPLEESTPLSGLDQIQKLLIERIGTQVSGDEFIQSLNSEFIRRIPIASTIHLDNESQRIIVPVDAYRIRLPNDTTLFVQLKGALCTSSPENCEVRLLSLGPSYAQPHLNRLRCKLQDSDCCDSLSWSTVRKLEGVKEKHVFLGEHQHCSLFQDSCWQDGISLNMGTRLKGGPR